MAQRIGKSRDKSHESKGKRKDGDFSKFNKKKTLPKKNTKRIIPPKKHIQEDIEDTTIHIPKDESMRLNKYIAHAGICSRREADRLIESGVIKVNGKIITEHGYKVKRGEKVHMEGQLLMAEKLQYILLNKPKGFVTTTDDPQERRTVMQLIKRAGEERVYPVGRLDLKTKGLLLFTNDGDLAKKLTHPKHRVRKVYHVYLNKPLTKTDLIKLSDGIVLEDGPIVVDKIGYVEDIDSKQEVGVQIHSGRNRIIRRMFEHMGYEVEKLDRVVFGGLTKKDLPRGKWRNLSKKEIDFLKMI
jgi:23S rRNA pseudouridine2605 synthase